jgi:hypothetical protein
MSFTFIQLTKKLLSSRKFRQYKTNLILPHISNDITSRISIDQLGLSLTNLVR